MMTERKIELYYNQPINKLLIISELEHKETILKNTKGVIIRCIKLKYVPYFKKILMNHYMLLKNKYNIYESIATYRDIPLFSYNSKLRTKQYNNWTEKQLYKKYINKYEFIIDFDNKDNDFELTKQECIAVSDYFITLKIKHEVKLSGSGLHLKTNQIVENPEKARLIAEKLIRMFGLTTIDLSIYRWQGIIKTKYTIDYKTNRVSLPINKLDLENFKLNDYHVDKIIDRKGLLPVKYYERRNKKSNKPL